MANPRNYYRPTTLEDALERAIHPGSIALAGGALTLGGIVLPYETLVDLQAIPALHQIEVRDGMITIGGAVSLQQVVRLSSAPEVLKQSLTRALPLNIRNGASVGESLTVADPPPEWLATLVALGATIEHAGKLGSRDQDTFWEQPVAEFVTLLNEHGHPYQGIVKALNLPPLNNDTAVGIAHVARTPADRPIVNASARLRLDEDGSVTEALVVICGASKTPVLTLELSALAGKALTDASMAVAIESIPERVHPVGDYLGSVEYRQQMASLCVRRALENCREQHQS